MFSKRTVLIACIIVFLAANFAFLVFSSRRPYSAYGTERVAISLVGPFQEIVTKTIRFFKGIWRHYFFLVSVSAENERLRKALSLAAEANNRCKEAEISNLHYRKLLEFKPSVGEKTVAAEVIGKDPSPWFKSIVINKGTVHGLRKGLPVAIPEGVVGVVTETASRYAKVLLVVDQNSAVDALVQRTRARGIIEGSGADQCSFRYVLRRHDIQAGDVVVSSGLDGVFPKGLRIGSVSEVSRHVSGIFQEVRVTPCVDFETIEHVLVLSVPSPPPEFPDER